MTVPTTETGARTNGTDAGARRREADFPVGPSLDGTPRRRQSDGWLDRWVATTADLTRLKHEHPMVDAVIDEQIGRRIRIGDRWLTDWASCNYLGFDLDEEIIAAVPEYLAKWGTHPSWSRLLGSPRLYEEIEATTTELLGCEDVLLLPTITHIHMSVLPVLAADGTVFLDGRAHKTIYDGAMVAAGHGARVVRFRHNDVAHLEELLAASHPGQARVIAMDGVNSMTGNAPDLAAFARLAEEHDGLLYVDDAHGFGVIGERSSNELCDYGTSGNSLLRHQDVSYDNVVLVAGFSKAYSSLLAFVALPDQAQGCLEGARPSVPLLGSVADRVARDHDRRPGGQPRPRGHRSLRHVAALPSRARRAARPGHRDPERERVPDHRDPARRPRRDRRRRPLPVRRGDLHDHGGLPAGAEGRGRLPDPDHGSQHGRGDRPPDRGPRLAARPVPAPPGGAASAQAASASA